MKRFLAVLLLTGCIVKKEEIHNHPCVVVPPKASEIREVLINGELANPKDWPTIFKSKHGNALAPLPQLDRTHYRLLSIALPEQSQQR